ncbi:permease [Candidatus Saganbacteria bacterium]|nr:permease [Candidatus Saganbacteria bacterium]
MNYRKLAKDYLWAALFLLFSIGSAFLGFKPGIAIFRNFNVFIIEVLTFLPLMFLLVGLFDVWVPKESIEKHIGRQSGLVGSLWVILLAMLQAGPLYAAFPVAYILSKKGASVRNIFVYLGAFSCLKLPLLTFEIGFLGFKFTLLRSLFTLPLFIVIGVLMEKILGKDYRVREGK